MARVFEGGEGAVGEIGKDDDLKDNQDEMCSGINKDVWKKVDQDCLCDGGEGGKRKDASEKFLTFEGIGIELGGGAGGVGEAFGDDAFVVTTDGGGEDGAEGCHGVPAERVLQKVHLDGEKHGGDDIEQGVEHVHGPTDKGE